ncbi:MAG: hypothetical protein KatS3mg080_0183 [Anoxybacillus sp.]|nr:MAG: hypothetical protein KatS3mg080_0183 [Anoxybacillus sp.]
MTVPSELETAIEVALGGSSATYRRRERTKRTRSHSIFKATCVRTSDVFAARRHSRKDRFLHPFGRLLKHPAYVGIASELISYEATYEHVMTNILGTVIVTTDLKGSE